MKCFALSGPHICLQQNFIVAAIMEMLSVGNFLIPLCNFPMIRGDYDKPYPLEHSQSYRIGRGADPVHLSSNVIDQKLRQRLHEPAWSFADHICCATVSLLDNCSLPCDCLSCFQIKFECSTYTDFRFEDKLCYVYVAANSSEGKL